MHTSTATPLDPATSDTPLDPLRNIQDVLAANNHFSRPARESLLRCYSSAELEQLERTLATPVAALHVRFSLLRCPRTSRRRLGRKASTVVAGRVGALAAVVVRMLAKSWREMSVRIAMALEDEAVGCLIRESEISAAAIT